MKIKDIVAYNRAGVNEDGEAYKVTQNDPKIGLTLAKPDGTQLILPPEKMASVMADPNNPDRFTMNPDAVADTQTDPNKPMGPEIGKEVEIAAAEDIGGDPTDDFIKDVSVKPHVSGSYNYEDQDNSFSMSPEEFMTGLAQTARENDTDLSPDDMESAKKFIVPDGHGNVDIMLTMQKMSQVFKNPEFLKMIDDLKALTANTSSPEMVDEAPDAKYDQWLKSVRDFQTTPSTSDTYQQSQMSNADMIPDSVKNKTTSQPTARPTSIKPGTPPSPEKIVKEADDALLQQMRMIAGLR